MRFAAIEMYIHETKNPYANRNPKPQPYRAYQVTNPIRPMNKSSWKWLFTKTEIKNGAGGSQTMSIHLAGDNAACCGCRQFAELPTQSSNSQQKWPSVEYMSIKSGNECLCAPGRENRRCDMVQSLIRHCSPQTKGGRGRTVCRPVNSTLHWPLCVRLCAVSWRWSVGLDGAWRSKGGWKRSGVTTRRRPRLHDCCMAESLRRHHLIGLGDGIVRRKSDTLPRKIVLQCWLVTGCTYIIVNCLVSPVWLLYKSPNWTKVKNSPISVLRR